MRIIDLREGKQNEKPRKPKCMLDIILFMTSHGHLTLIRQDLSVHVETKCLHTHIVSTLPLMHDSGGKNGSLVPSYLCGHPSLHLTAITQLNSWKGKSTCCMIVQGWSKYQPLI